MNVNTHRHKGTKTVQVEHSLNRVPFTINCFQIASSSSYEHSRVNRKGEDSGYSLIIYGDISTDYVMQGRCSLRFWDKQVFSYASRQSSLKRPDYTLITYCSSLVILNFNWLQEIIITVYWKFSISIHINPNPIFRYRFIQLQNYWTTLTIFSLLFDKKKLPIP